VVIAPRVIGPIIGGQVPQTSHATGDGNGNGNGHGNGNGNGNGNGDAGSGTPTGTGSGNAGGPSHGVPTGDPGQSGPTGDPGQNGPTGDPGQNGPTGDPGQNGPTGDPGQNGPTGDHHHRRDGQGSGNSGQTNPPVPVPVPTPTPTPTPTVSHTPSQPTTTTTPAPITVPVTPITPVTSTTPPVTKTPTPTPRPTSKGGGFPVPVIAVRSAHTQHNSNPLLSANDSGITVPLSSIANTLTGIANQPGLAATTASVGLSTTAANQTVAARAAAAQTAANKAGTGHRAKHASSGSGSFSPLTTTVTNFVRFIPSSVWIALAASLGLALMGATAAVASGRRARRQAKRVAEVSAVALTDSLTGVLNRRGFTEAAERELDRAGRHGRPFVLAYIDVRGLKGVNDGEGHLAGDRLLKAATAVLTESVRAHDVVGRLGGDEFGLLLTEQTSQDAEQVAERIAEKVAASRIALNFGAHWDLTVGLASFPEDGATIEELLNVADRRLYEQRGIALAGHR
jgi:diguanylate cyclase (GGDEF)-like protein